MAQLGKPIDLSQHLRANRLRQRIVQIGVELEGGWTKIPKGQRIVRDGSVFNDNMPSHKPPLVAVGELTSEPMPPKALADFLNKCYPHLHDETCGMHIHMSLRNPLSYMRLMDPRYPATIVDYTTKWSEKNLPQEHHIWGRLKGESRYCRHEFSADMQVLTRQKDWNHNRPGNRYTVVNYCYQRTRTVEVRLLPMMPTTELAYSALNMIMDVTNAFLVATAAREKAESFVLDGGHDPTIEEAIEIHV